MRSMASRVAAIGAFASLVVFTAASADAQRGGGGRGGATSVNRGGGGGGGGGGTGFSRGGNYSRPSGAGGAAQLPAQGGARPSQLPTQGGNRGNINTGNINRGNVNTGNINTGNINVNVNQKYNYGYKSGCCYGWNDYPVGAGLAIGMVAGVTAAAIGSRYYALPPACAPYPYHGYTYYSCGGVWYQPSYQGDTVVYVVVAKPG
jgi:hypothetical protein